VAEVKRWAALHYFVARRQGFANDTSALGKKQTEFMREQAREEISAIVEAGRARLADMHVAYHIEFLEFLPGSSPGILRGRRGLVVEGADLVEEDLPPFIEEPSEELLRAKDVRRFFQWARDTVPAQHLAVFFWGHSAGPAGMFELLEGPDPQDADTPPLAPPAGGGDNASLLALRQLAKAFKEDLRQTCDVALFKNCWMGTLELAYQLADLVGTVVASQSQIPTKTDWPYGAMYDSLTAVGHTLDVVPAADFVPLIEQLDQQYQPIAARTIDGGVIPAVPFALLDVTKVRGVREPLSALVGVLGTEPLTVSQHEARAAFDAASTGPLLDDAGDIALVDVLTLCEELETRAPGEIGDAARALGDVVKPLIIKASPGGTPGRCRGVSLFYQPSEARKQTASQAFDNFAVSAAVRRANYRKLSLITDVASPPRWVDIGFEQPLSNHPLSNHPPVVTEESMTDTEDKGQTLALKQKHAEKVSETFAGMKGVAKGMAAAVTAQPSNAEKLRELWEDLADQFEVLHDVWKEVAASTNDTEGDKSSEAAKADKQEVPA
jgi:hypothetical protein